MKLEQLLAPLSPAAFFAEHWERKPLHLQGRPERFLGLGFDEATFWSTVAELPEDARCLRAIYYDQKGKHRELLAIRPSIARALWESGMTLAFAYLEDHSAPVRALLAELRGQLELPGQISVVGFFSPRDHGAGLHYDNHPAIVLQLEGKKRWQISREPALEFPPRNYGYESDDALEERSPHLATKPPRMEEFLEVELVPGDVLYMPPGTWHRPRSFGGGGSLALTLGPFITTPLQLAVAELERGLAERLEWRRPVPIGLAKEAPRTGLPQEVERVLEQRLADLRAYVNGITVQDLARSWHAQVAVPRPVSLEALTAAEAPLAPDQRIHRDLSRRVSCLEHPREEKVFLYVDGEEIDLPLAARPFMDALLARESFVAGEACAWVAEGEEPFDWEDVKGILEILLTRGFLRRS
ncbi:MAG TPA: cupin domain-containing protein [Planctomycetota bacterium]|nr:cupin domain-containing protein [Planctomycetota bacterium]